MQKIDSMGSEVGGAKYCDVYIYIVGSILTIWCFCIIAHIGMQMYCANSSEQLFWEGPNNTF